jgi:hypothetical protein
LDDLYKWREKFDEIKVKYWKQNTKQPRKELRKNFNYDNYGKVPRVSYVGKNKPGTIKKPGAIFESLDKKLET